MNSILKLSILFICSLCLSIGSLAQPDVNDIILFEEDWENAVANTIPSGWSGDVDEAITLDTAWVLGMGPSSTAATGPNSAHAGSQYFYFDSGSPAGPGEMAELISPMINISGNNTTLNFALYMYGTDIQMLDVSVIHGGTTTLLQRYDMELQSSKTELWSIQNLDLSTYNGQSVQISFEAQKMVLSAGDIAIDSIYVFSQGVTTAIPTLGQWCIVILSLILMIVIAIALNPISTSSRINE